MTTAILSKKTFLEYISRQLTKDDFIIFSNSLNGTMCACSKKNNSKRISFGFNGDVFKMPNSIGDIMDTKLGAYIICKKQILSEKIKKQIDEEE